MCPSASMPDLLTSVKLLATPTVEIAAASVGERSLVNAVRQIEERKGTDSMVDVAEPEAPVEVVADEVAGEEAAEETNVSEGDPEDAEVPAAKGEMEVSISAECDDEKTMAPPPEELAAPTEEQVGDTEADAARVEAQSPEEPSPTEEAPPAEEVTAAPDEAEEPTAEDTETVQLVEASAEADAEAFSATQSEPEAAVHEAESCHCAPPADNPVPSVAVEGVVACEETMDSTLELEEQVAPSKSNVHHSNGLICCFL